MPQQKVEDLSHFEHEAKVLNLSVEKNWITYRLVGGNIREEVPIGKFAMGQVLKFGELKKSEAKDMPTKDILHRIGGKHIILKRNDERILAAVSPDFVNIPSRDVDRTVRDVFNTLGLKVKNVEVEKGLVTRVWYRLSGLEGEDGFEPGVYLRNSAFGASALGLGRYYHVEDNGSRLMLQKTHTYQKYHVGKDDIHDDIRQSVMDIISNMWVDIDQVKRCSTTHFPKSKQVETVYKYQANRRITKEMCDKLIAHIDHETWSSGEETLWTFIKTVTGYATHGDISTQNRKRLERMSEELLQEAPREPMTA